MQLYSLLLGSNGWNYCVLPDSDFLIILLYMALAEIKYIIIILLFLTLFNIWQREQFNANTLPSEKYLF